MIIDLFLTLWCRITQHKWVTTAGSRQCLRCGETDWTFFPRGTWEGPDDDGEMART